MWIKYELYMDLQVGYVGFYRWIIKISGFFFFSLSIFPSVFSHIHPRSQEVLNKVNPKVFSQLFIRGKKKVF